MSKRLGVINMSEEVEKFLESGVKSGRGLVSLMRDVEALNVSHDKPDILASAKAVAGRKGIKWEVVQRWLDRSDNLG